MLTSILCASTFAALQAADRVGVYLTWRDDPTTSIVVNWVDREEDTPTRAFLERAGAWRAAMPSTVPLADTGRFVHRVEWRELSPGTVYRFAVGLEVQAEGARSFRTLSSDPKDPIRFVTGGDMFHRRDWLDEMNRRAGLLEPDFALLGGDLAYGNGSRIERWDEWLASWTQNAVTPGGRVIPMVVGIGNHEIRRGVEGAPANAPYFYPLFREPGGQPNRTFDIGSRLSIVVLDSGHSVSIPSQTEWLRAALRERKDVEHLFACYHFPAYGTQKAPPGTRDPSLNPRAMKIREGWVPLFEEFGVDAVFENDHHTYKRSWPLREEAVDGDRGVLFLGDGAWGVKTRAVPNAEQLWYLRRAEARRHLIAVDVPGRAGAPVRYRAIDAAGVVFDDWPERPRTARTVAFSAFGCGPYTGGAREATSDWVELVEDDGESEFLIHLGDIVNGGAARAGLANEGYYRGIAELLEGRRRVPTYVVLGDNEWNDTPDPVAARGYWDAALLHYDRQYSKPWNTANQVERPENFAFVHKGVLFVGVTLVGGRMHDADEWSRYLRESGAWATKWLQQSSANTRAAVLMCQAQPNASGRHAPFMQPFLDAAADYAKPVLFLHSDGHRWILDRPWRARNVTRLQIDLITEVHPPVLVRIDDVPNDPFRFERRLR